MVQYISRPRSRGRGLLAGHCGANRFGASGFMFPILMAGFHGKLERQGMALGQMNKKHGTGRTSCRFRAACAVVAVLLSTTMGRTANIPTLLVLPLEMADTSGETRPRAHEDRLATLTGYLSKQLAAHGLYTIIDPTPIDT